MPPPLHCPSLRCESRYGNEDAALTSLFMVGFEDFRVTRSCSPWLWHRYHKKKGWGWTLDGMNRDKHFGPNPWRPDPQGAWKLPLPWPLDAGVNLRDSALLLSDECYLLSCGIIYP